MWSSYEYMNHLKVVQDFGRPSPFLTVIERLCDEGDWR